MEAGRDLEDVVPSALISPQKWRREVGVAKVEVAVRKASWRSLKRKDDAMLEGLARFLLAFAKESAKVELACREFLRTPGVPNFPFPVSALSASFLRGVTVESLGTAFAELGKGNNDDRPTLHELRLIASYYRSRHLERDPSGAGDAAAPLSTVYSTFLSHSVAAAEYLAGTGVYTTPTATTTGTVKSTADRAVAKARKAASSALEQATAAAASAPPLDDVDIARKFLRALWQQGRSLQRIDEMKRELSAAHLDFHVPTLFQRVRGDDGGGGGGGAAAAALQVGLGLVARALEKEHVAMGVRSCCCRVSWLCSGARMLGCSDALLCSALLCSTPLALRRGHNTLIHAQVKADALLFAPRHTETAATAGKRSHDQEVPHDAVYPHPACRARVPVQTQTESGDTISEGRASSIHAHALLVRGRLCGDGLAICGLRPVTSLVS